jgi:hypothetical protein
MAIEIYDNVFIDETIFNEVFKTKKELESLCDDKPSFHQIMNKFDVNAWFFKCTGKKIKSYDFWTNFVTVRKDGTNNCFEWHEDRYGIRFSDDKDQRQFRLDDVEEHMTGEYTCIVWIDGEKNQGGALHILIDDGSEVIEFEKNKIIVFPIDSFHKVDEYHSYEYRISVMFTFDFL